MPSTAGRKSRVPPTSFSTPATTYQSAWGRASRAKSGSHRARSLLLGSNGFASTGRWRASGGSGSGETAGKEAGFDPDTGASDDGVRHSGPRRGADHGGDRAV